LAAVRKGKGNGDNCRKGQGGRLSKKGFRGIGEGGEYEEGKSFDVRIRRFLVRCGKNDEKEKRIKRQYVGGENTSP